MGAFQSKSLAEQIESAKVQSGNEEEALMELQFGREREHKDGSSKKKDDNDLVKVSPEDFGVSLPVMLIGGATWLVMCVAAQYGSYMYAQKTVDMCDEVIQTVQASLEGVPECNQNRYLVRELVVWKKKRESAIAYMKRHPLIGKLVEMFPPDGR